MMYLLEPSRAMWWSRQPAALWLAQARVQGYDLAQIDDWTRAEREADDVTLRLALRHGVPCSRGLVVDGGIASLHLAQSPALPPAEPDPREQLARALDAARWQSGIDPEPPPLGGSDAPRAATDPALSPPDPDLVEALRPAPDEDALRGWMSLRGPLPAPL